MSEGSLTKEEIGLIDNFALSFAIANQLPDELYELAHKAIKARREYFATLFDRIQKQ